MATLDQFHDVDNLARAWRWVRSNPDALFKNYFRPLYANYAIADDVLLTDLQARLRRGVYEPEHSCKLYFPKTSGIMRPYTLLTVEDQIVYQAMVNVVAEHLHPKVRSRYLVEVFGHLYAGKASPWFYQKWQKGYGRFNQAARQAFADGFRHAAHFDLTAFYDSLDHGVLRHFLGKIGCDQDFSETLIRRLSHWTATKDRIYHHHGIPQGPLASGLLAEVVLQHFDRNHGSPTNVRYLRYVDDIRLFARSVGELRRMLTKLDLLSKSVGLFPQASKIDIHRVEDIEAELKSVSRPAEDFLDGDGGVVDQAGLRRRLVDLSPRFKVADPTEFKFLLGMAEPSAKLNDRLWRVLEVHPELYANVMHYFRRYRTLPRRAGDMLIGQIKTPQLYAAVLAEMLRTAEGRLSERQMAEVDKVVKANWKPNVHVADLIAALGRWALGRALLTYSQVEFAVRNLKEWWARAELVAAVEDRLMGRPSLQALLNAKLEDKVSDVALAAAVKITNAGFAVTVPEAAVQPVAARALEAFGLISSFPNRVCGVEMSLGRFLGRPAPVIDWQAVFGPEYQSAERLALWCRAYADTDVTAWVNATDVFNDLLLTRLYAHDTSLGGYRGGKIGSVLPTSTRLKGTYPAVHAWMQSVHEKRSESSLSHPWTFKAGKPVRPTGRIKYTYLRIAKRLLTQALKELAAKW